MARASWTPAGLRRSELGFVVLFGGGVAILLVVTAGALTLGSTALSIHDVVRALADAVLGSGRSSETASTIIVELRLPRVLGAVVVGGTLSVVGASLQAVTRNPLADPYVLGLSSGASMGTTLAVVLGAASVGGGLSSIAGFGGALLAVFVVYRLAEVGGRVPPVRLLLAGVALSSFGSAVTGFVLYLTPEATAVRGLIFWLMGGLGTADWRGLVSAATFALPCVLLLGLSARWQNVLLLGDETALTLGLDVPAARRALILICALATAAVVAFSGAIGFVGLVIPHALRALTGPDHRRLVPTAFVFGAALLVVMDALARVLIAPVELPVGILTGLLGAPFFLAMLSRTKESFHG